MLIEALLSSHGDVGVHSAIDRVWSWVVCGDYVGVESVWSADGRVLGFNNDAGDSGDWEESSIKAVLKPDAGQRAVALEEVLQDVIAHRHNMTVAHCIKLSEG